ncbi:unknown [Firmicutes bacterium CAG:110]|nr:unknown [Firmicutes bacterium CAG:110]
MENKGIRELRKSKTLHRFLDFDMYRGTGLGAFRLSGSSIQEQYILKQERREEYERKRRKEQAFEEEADNRSAGKNTNASGGTDRPSRTRQKQ